MSILLVGAAALLTLIALAWRREARLRGRSRLLGEILDLADALERELLDCRRSLREVPALTASLSPAGQIAARATLGAEPQVQDALRDLLAHRLWLKEHAADASAVELADAKAALIATRGALGDALRRFAEVRDEVERSRTPADARKPDPPARLPGPT